MNQPINGHSAEYIKRQAKKIKKETGVPYHEALEKAARNAGFSNWKHFLNSSGGNVLSFDEGKKTPRPAVVSFYRMLSQTPDYRPNARMPIAAHQEIGKLLKEVCTASNFVRKSVYNPVNSVRCELDDWIQQEYKSNEELPNEVFLQIYYHGTGASSVQKLSIEQQDTLCGNLHKAKEILDQNYHDCKPLRSLYKRLDRAIKAIERWAESPATTGQKGARVSRSEPIPKGTFVRLKPWKGEGIVIPDQHGGLGVRCFTHNGTCYLARYEVSVCRDQTPAKNFRPMRLYMPYGKWTCADGTEVLFNRDYCPMWAKLPDGSVIPLDPDTWISYRDQEWYFGDGTAPWDNKASFEKCVNVLKEWGIDGKSTRLLEMLPDVIDTGNERILEQKNTSKQFPWKDIA